MLYNDGVLRKVALIYLCLDVFWLENTLKFSFLYFRHIAKYPELQDLLKVMIISIAYKTNTSSVFLMDT